MALTKPDRDILTIAAGIKAGAELTIASGAVILAENAHAVDTEADAASDDLDTINAGPVPDGAMILLYAANGARMVVLKHGTGNIQIQGGGDISLDDANKSVLLRRDGANFRDVVTAAMAGGVVQVVHVQDGAVATGTTLMPADDTIPQNTEGDEYMTLAITPTNANNILIIEAVVHLAGTAATNQIFGVGLFQDAVAGALAVAHQAESSSTTVVVQNIVLRHRMVAGTVSPTTFKIRAGQSAAGTTTFNGAGGVRRFGGVLASSITITEIAA